MEGEYLDINPYREPCYDDYGSYYDERGSSYDERESYHDVRDWRYYDDVRRRRFDPGSFGWKDDVPAEHILRENLRGTFINIREADRGYVRHHIAVFIHGSCPHNGEPDALGSYGIYFGSDSPFNKSGLLPRDSLQTSQRAALTAAIVTLAMFAECHKRYSQITNLIVVTDSRYLVNAITEHIVRWKSNGWITLDGAKVANRDLWEELERHCINALEHDINVYFWEVHREEVDCAVRMAEGALVDFLDGEAELSR
jgi:ribonuclease HI